MSCKNSSNDFMRIDLSDAVEYIEAPPGYFVGDMIRLENEFKPLEKKDMGHVLNLLENENNYLWLRIRFDIPRELQDADLGLYIGYIHSADRVWLNNSAIRTYGSFPPNALGAGYQAQYFMFPRNILKQKETNTILIQVWTGISISMSDEIFVAPQKDIFQKAERHSFFNSRIYLCAAVIMLLICFLYMILFVKMRKFDESRTYLYFGLLVFYSLGFLLPFYIAEIPWIKPVYMSYSIIVKWFMCFGAYTAIYFASSFITNWLRYKESRKTIVIRMLLWGIPLVVTLTAPSLKSLISYAPFLFLIVISQFCFCMPKFFKAFRDNTRRQLAKQCLLGYSPVLIGLVIDFIVRLILKNRNLPFFSLYGWQLTLYTFLFYLMSRFAQMYMHSTALKEQLTEFNAHLEDVVAIRTKELSETNFMLSRGLETVAHVQKNFLPKKDTVFRGWQLAVSYNPLDNNVSGDLYDYYYTDQTLDGFGIFDVSGHGIPAGLMTILAKSIISQHFISGLSQNRSMSDVLKDINDSYIKEKSNVENYITGILFHFGAFDKKDKCPVELANAGHPAPLLYSKESDSVTEVKYENPNEQYGILGVDGLPVSFPAVNCSMGVNDILVCFTDGLTEATNSDSEDFGKQRLIDILKENNSKSAEEIKESIMTAYKEFVGKQKPFDDLTIIVLKRTLSKDFLEEI
ncbi:MAG: SpoIIE family protein phosphatase [Treponema sp.]|nr:SpoIIE family protein phosphatase [Treponema sp.]